VTFEARSWAKSGSGLDDDGERETGVELCELIETVLSDGAKGLAARGEWADGGASPLPLPRILPPPSFRADMTVGSSGDE
jgi:hypothetical protein